MECTKAEAKAAKAEAKAAKAKEKAEAKAAKAKEKAEAKAAKAKEKAEAKATKEKEKVEAKAAKVKEKAVAKAAKEKEKADAKAAKAKAKADKKKAKAEADAITYGTTIIPEDIRCFNVSSSRDENDAANKKRESILAFLESVPTEYFEHAEYGAQWRALHTAWNAKLGALATRAGAAPDTPRTIHSRGGRTYNYDLDVTFHLPDGTSPSFKCEFKYGCPSIDRLPQFLSLPVGSSSELLVGGKPYDQEFYDSGALDRMIACDPGITEPKPDRETYLREVKRIESNHPFFRQLKEREHVAEKEKKRVVKEADSAYTASITINTEAFAAKARATQAGKIYLLWCNGDFHIDEFRDDDFNGITLKGVNGPHIYLVSGNGRIVFDLLLRWRNHMGILNPAWQIAARRC
jgi:hypothetical protein